MHDDYEYEEEECYSDSDDYSDEDLEDYLNCQNVRK